MKSNKKTASAEQHREWIQDNDFTIADWELGGYKQYKSEGATSKPHRKFNKPASWFTGRKHGAGKPREKRVNSLGLAATLEQHKKWITDNDYTMEQWGTIGYPKYKKQGAYRFPTLAFNVTWGELRGNDTRAEAEQHRKWITKHMYTATEWLSVGYPKYKKQGAYSNPTVQFNVSWYWLKSKTK